MEIKAGVATCSRKRSPFLSKKKKIDTIREREREREREKTREIDLREERAIQI